MATGTVTAITAEGFGFVAPDKHTGELWMRPPGIEGGPRLQKGQHVEYVLAGGPAGVEAANVRPLEA
jgi:cold shock CspA family protein